ncbi:hypothetical protein V5P93_002293 [Actinokineospora auranticolor]|uniref:Uncharacterized protein n=1 Tax=Actinokineospora auranticolor TaxID=155976 RepID=A0A2S6GDV6_9PSEU|nr:hypothetical protein [Actinokineospora auranticolor]PPK63321.1 hypothetical protein CLV40_12934 [Actinokineospora auranticolor]
MYRSMKGSAQQVIAAGTAVLLAFFAVRLVPAPAVALGVAVLAGLLIGKLSVFGESGK